MFVLIPIFSDGFLHPLHKDNDLSLLYIRHWGDREGRIICLSHPDCGDKESIDEIKNNQTNFYVTPDRKKLLHIFPDTRLVDANMMNWLKTSKPINFEDIRINSYDFFRSKYYNVKNLNLIIPLVKHKEYCDKVFDRITENMHQVYEVMYTEAIDAFYSIERKGIKVSDDVCDIFDARVKKHISDGKLYSQYNLWTATGRPSNSFGSVNFAALNKEQRKAFIPENDMLVEYDYDAYHLRLIADLIGYNFPQGSVHKYMSKFYNCDYSEAKNKSFAYLYGGIPNEIAENIPFFNKVKKFIDLKWKEYNERNYIQTYIYNRRIIFDDSSAVNANKLFNYLIQAHETESNIKTINELQQYLCDKNTDLVLYGYDSFLFDYSEKDGENILLEIKLILENESHLSKMKKGYNYMDMR